MTSKESIDIAAARESFDGDVKFVVYNQRFYVLAALSLNYFMWNWHGTRHNIIAPSYAEFYNTTNNFDLFGSGELGVDSLSLIPAFVRVFSYIPCAYVIDRLGIRWVKLGSFGITLQAWIWYMNDAGFFGAPTILTPVIIKIFTNMVNPLVSSALLAVSNRWFPAPERAKATATVALVSILGSVAVVLIGPQFELSKDEINLDLKSCRPSEETILKYNVFISNGTTPFCDTSDSAASEFGEFCCFAPADVVTYGLVLAILCTLLTMFTFIVIKDAPPTPPSASNEDVGRLPSFLIAVYHMKNFRNYLTLCLADFTVAGPPIVLSVTIARLLPPIIKEFDFYIAGAGIVFAIPAAAYVAYVLDKKHIYWDLTAGGYSFGAMAWTLATILFAIGGIGGYFMAPLLILAIVAFTAWQAAVYETKLEYVYSKKFQIEGLVVGIDRLLANLATAIFVPILAPESVGGALNTYIIGTALFITGAVLPFTIKNRRAYLRQAVENEKCEAMKAIQADAI